MHASQKINWPDGLREIKQELKDTEGTLVTVDALYELDNGSLAECIAYLKSIYKNELCLLPIGALSAGGGVFNIAKKSETEKVVGLKILSPQPKNELGIIEYTISENAPDYKLKTQDLHINTKDKKVYVGCAVILEQINASIRDALGQQFCVLGTDLTSSGYATAGASFMTGGMGPSRIHFANNILANKIYYDDATQHISERSNLESYMETYGWTGIVESLTLPIVEMPLSRFGFAVPINNTPKELSHLIKYFANKTHCTIENAKLNVKDVFIEGIEFMTQSALKLLTSHVPDMPKLANLMETIMAAQKNSVAFITGYAHYNPYLNEQDPLGIFKENNETGLALEQAFPFDNLSEMKNIREGAPDFARRQFTDYSFSYKEHTDINIILNAELVAQSMEAVMKCYENYATKINELISDNEHLNGDLQIYGHLNPQGVDPHYRITLASKNQEMLEAAKKEAKEYYNKLVVDLNNACNNTKSKMTGGEKGIISNMKIINALKENNEVVPKELNDQFLKQKETILSSQKIYNWRNKLS